MELNELFHARKFHVLLRTVGICIGNVLVWNK